MTAGPPAGPAFRAQVLRDRAEGYRRCAIQSLVGAALLWLAPLMVTILIGGGEPPDGPLPPGVVSVTRLLGIVLYFTHLVALLGALLGFGYLTAAGFCLYEARATLREAADRPARKSVTAGHVVPGAAALSEAGALTAQTAPDDDGIYTAAQVFDLLPPDIRKALTTPAPPGPLRDRAR